jgi:hypothetical protein
VPNVAEIKTRQDYYQSAGTQIKLVNGSGCGCGEWANSRRSRALGAVANTQRQTNTPRKKGDSMSVKVTDSAADKLSGMDRTKRKDGNSRTGGNPPMGDARVTVQQVAENWQVSQRMIRRMIADGRLPVVRLG